MVSTYSLFEPTKGYSIKHWLKVTIHFASIFYGSVLGPHLKKFSNFSYFFPHFSESEKWKKIPHVALIRFRNFHNINKVTVSIKNVWLHGQEFL